MTELQHYSLDSSKIIAYLQDNLDETNALSSMIYKYVNFEEGVFYTILRENIKNEQLYGFRWGGVGEDVRDKVCNMLFVELHDNPNMKSDGKLGRNYLKGKEGDKTNAILVGVGHNLRMILRKLRIFLLVPTF